VCNPSSRHWIRLSQYLQSRLCLPFHHSVKGITDVADRQLDSLATPNRRWYNETPVVVYSWEKKMPWRSCRLLCQMVTDFQSSFTNKTEFQHVTNVSAPGQKGFIPTAFVLPPGESLLLCARWDRQTLNRCTYAGLSNGSSQCYRSHTFKTALNFPDCWPPRTHFVCCYTTCEITTTTI